MIKLKKIFLVSFILLFSDLVFGSEQESNWSFDWDGGTTHYLLSKNQGNRFTLVCTKNKYFTAIELNKKILSESDTFYYEVDSNHSMVFMGSTFVKTWLIKGITYNSLSNDMKEYMDKYKILFQQMLNAKESLTVSAQDADGNKYSVSFSVKGLPEALMDFAERCGPEFQEFSGIKPNPKIEP